MSFLRDTVQLGIKPTKAGEVERGLGFAVSEENYEPNSSDKHGK
jgi:hypothetical protein